MTAGKLLAVRELRGILKTSIFSLRICVNIKKQLGAAGDASSKHVFAERLRQKLHKLRKTHMGKMLAKY